MIETMFWGVLHANTQIQCTGKYSYWWNGRKPHQVQHFWKTLGAKMSWIIFWIVSHANTNYTQQLILIPPIVGMLYPILTYIYSTDTCSQNCCHHNQYKYTFSKIYIPQSCARRAHRNPPTYIHPPSVGMIYPIPTYVFNWHILPKLLAAYIQYKYTFSKMYIPWPCARRAHRNPPAYIHPQVLAWYIQYQHVFSTDIYSPNCWKHISKTNIYFFKCTLPNPVPEGHTETL